MMSHQKENGRGGGIKAFRGQYLKFNMCLLYIGLEVSVLSVGSMSFFEINWCDLTRHLPVIGRERPPAHPQSTVNSSSISFL